MFYDVIIAGAGPGGAYTAYNLAREGLDVLVIEKEKLPRYKSCGGAISGKANSLLTNFDLSTIIEDKINHISFYYNFDNEIKIDFEKPFVRLVMRDKFDHFLIKKAQGKGAKIIENSSVIDLEMAPNKIKVITDNSIFKTKFIVGADGINSLVATKLNLTPDIISAVGLEKEIKVNPSKLKKQQNKINLDYGILPKGYGWTFPKKDHLSVGVATYQQGIDLKQKLNNYLLGENYSNYKELKTRGHLIPIWNTTNKLNTAQGILVGDAAGLVDPLSGEGIFYALKSGELASKTIIEAINKGTSLDKYTELINRTLVPEFSKAKLLAKPFLLFPDKVHKLLASKQWLLKEFLRVIYGKEEYNSLYKLFITEIPIFNHLVGNK